MAIFCGLMPLNPALAAPARCDASPSANKAIVLDFYALAFEQLKVREAFQRYASPRFVEHSDDAPGGTLSGIIAFLEDMIARFPQRRWEVVRSAAEDDVTP